MGGYVKTFTDKNNRLMSFSMDNDKLLEKYKTIWTKIDNLRNIELNTLPVYDDRYIKTKIRTYGDKVYTLFCALNVPDCGVEYESFTIISIDFWLVYENEYYLQVYLYNYAYKIVKNTNYRLSWWQSFWIWWNSVLKMICQIDLT